MHFENWTECAEAIVFSYCKHFQENSCMQSGIDMNQEPPAEGPTNIKDNKEKPTPDTATCSSHKTLYLSIGGAIIIVLAAVIALAVTLNPGDGTQPSYNRPHSF